MSAAFRNIPAIDLTTGRSFTLGLVFKPADPFVIGFEFRKPFFDADRTWRVARQLVFDAVSGYEVGIEGEVQMWNVSCDRTVLRLSDGGDRVSMFGMPTRPLHGFLTRTYRLVSRADEEAAAAAVVDSWLEQVTS